MVDAWLVTGARMNGLRWVPVSSDLCRDEWDGPVFVRLVADPDDPHLARMEVRSANLPGPDDPIGCPGEHGEQCFGRHDACRSALREEAA